MSAYEPPEVSVHNWFCSNWLRLRLMPLVSTLVPPEPTVPTST